MSIIFISPWFLPWRVRWLQRYFCLESCSGQVAIIFAQRLPLSVSIWICVIDEKGRRIKKDVGRLGKDKNLMD